MGYFDPKVLDPVGDINADIESVIAVASKFLLACYSKQYMTCKSITDARINIWKKKITSGPVRLSEILPTNEAAGKNIKHAHHQVAHWKSTMTGVLQI